MKKFLILLLVLALCGCAAPAAPSTEPATAPTMPMTTVPETTIPETTIPETTVPETTVPVTTAPPHSEFYLEDFAVEEIITYFNEVVLQVEYTDGTGDPSRVQKWLQPIICSIHGEPTMEDQQVLEQFFTELNQMPGFPGIRLAQPGEYANMTLSFLDADAFVSEFSEAVNGEDAWGACQFWYWTDTNELYDARIGYRTDIPQLERSSILLEEIVNSIGITDTLRRSDSIVYQDSNENLQPSVVDWLILKLLYHPDIQCGMDAQQCEQIIRELYY